MLEPEGENIQVQDTFYCVIWALKLRKPFGLNGRTGGAV